MKNSILADFILVIIALIWGTTFVVVQNAIVSIPPNTFNGWRFFLAALFLIIWSILFKRQVFKSFSKQLITAGLLLGIFLYLGYVFQTVGLLYTTSSKAAFITGLSVVLVPLFSYFFLKVTPTKFATIGVIIATVGLYLLTIIKDFSIHFGDMLVFLCAIAFGLHIVITAMVTKKFSALALTIIQLLTVSVLSFISSTLFNGIAKTFNVIAVIDGGALPAIIFTALFATAFAYLLQTTLQRYTTPTHVGLIFILEPVFAALTSFLWQKETMTFNAMVGCSLILAGMLLSEIPILKKKQNQQTT